MATITVNTSSGDRIEIEADDGDSLMEAITGNDIEGVDAICGGALSCATCHVYVSPEWAGKLEPQSENEKALLGGVEEVRATSRLSCQIKVSGRLSGMEITIPN